MMKRNKKILVSILFILISFVSVAQTGNNPPPPQSPTPPGLPVDMGIYILLVIGLIYGVVKTLKPKAKA